MRRRSIMWMKDRRRRDDGLGSPGLEQIGGAAGGWMAAYFLSAE